MVTVDANGELCSSPEVCKACRASRVELESAVTLEYTRGMVFVERRQKPGTQGVEFTTGAPAPSVESDFLLDGDEESNVEVGASAADSVDPAGRSSGDKTYAPPANTNNEEAASASNDRSQPRMRSQRASKGRHRLMVSSTTKMSEFKVQLMNKFSAMPLDMHVFMHDEEFLDDGRTFGELGIAPGTQLVVVIDERLDDLGVGPGGVGIAGRLF
jgi:hypothetical protein